MTGIDLTGNTHRREHVHAHAPHHPLRQHWIPCPSVALVAGGPYIGNADIHIAVGTRFRLEKSLTTTQMTPSPLGKPPMPTAPDSAFLPVESRHQ